MEYRRLGSTDLKISQLTLGTMTFGSQNTEREGHEQLDYAVERGITLVDTSEHYPVPPTAETQGSTESIIGTWLKVPGNRRKVLLATKVVGPSHVSRISSAHIREGNNHFTRANLESALHTSLARLQTDVIDLYQLHWPDRRTNFFGHLSYEHLEQEDTVPLEETLAVLDGFVKAGKVRHIGVSNETAWGVSRYLLLAATKGLARIVSIQNPYNFLNRSFDIGLAEIALRENVSLLGYSPLAFGVLTGKYLGGAKPRARASRCRSASRVTTTSRHRRRWRSMWRSRRPMASIPPRWRTRGLQLAGSSQAPSSAARRSRSSSAPSTVWICRCHPKC